MLLAMTRPPSILLLAVLLAAGVQTALALSPPWWIVAGEIKAALMTDKYANVTVREGKESITMRINVMPCTPLRQARGRRLTATRPCVTASLNKAVALATLLSYSATEQTAAYDTKVVVRVFRKNKLVEAGFTPSSPAAAGKLLRQALLGNSLFSSVRRNALLGAPMAVFKPTVVQYYSDDIAQVDGLTSKVAADLMSSAFYLESYPLAVSTTPCNGKDCPLPST